MNEFISNSGTLINPDSVYDQERFINILQIILQKKTQKELSEQTGLNNATISRMLIPVSCPKSISMRTVHSI